MYRHVAVTVLSSGCGRYGTIDSRDSFLMYVTWYLLMWLYVQSCMVCTNPTDLVARRAVAPPSVSAFYFTYILLAQLACQLAS